MSALLESWLAEATRTLSEESAARVRVEIEEHFGSAVANGATDEQAISALGDAVQANRAYRKVLLTKADSKWLGLVQRRAGAPTAQWYLMIVVGLLGGTTQILRGAPDEALVAIANAIMAAVFLVPRWVTIDTRLRSYLYRTLRLATAMSVPLAFATRWHWNLVFAACAAFAWSTLFVWAAYKDCLLRRKLPVEEWPKELYL